MDLSKVSTRVLRKELHARDKREEEARWKAVCAAHPCPECGGDPVKVAQDAVEEYRFAPRDDQERPMLWAPYESEMGTTGGLRYETTVTCVNGHATTTDQIKWFEEPQKGPPMLPPR